MSQDKETPSIPPLYGADRTRIAAAASASLPIEELAAQAFGGRASWNTHTRPGRIKARTLAIRLLVRASEVAMAARPQLAIKHVEAALRSLTLHPSNLLIDYLSGEWLSPLSMVKERMLEISGTIEQLALIVRSAEQEEPTQ